MYFANPIDFLVLLFGKFACFTFFYSLFRLILNVLQLLEHPFLRKYGNSDEELAAYARKVFDPTKRLKEMADVSFW